MEKIKESCEISLKAVSITTIRNGKLKQFYLEKGSVKCYMVSINDTNHANYHLFQSMLEHNFVNMPRSLLLTDLPFYECVDWKKHYLSCQHMFAVMKKFEMSWESFPTKYRDSPFFKTDFD